VLENVCGLDSAAPTDAEAMRLIRDAEERIRQAQASGRSVLS